MWALKYRPKTFEEVVEQEDAIAVLKKSVGKSNTFILHGDSGTGKTSLARIFANHINGEAIEINGADNNGVDNVRELISAASYVPAFNDYRVFIIDECHVLTTAAWNALLKILEESPKSTVWVLCTTEYAKIPQTIKSRGILIKVKRISRQGIRNQIEKICEAEGCNFDDAFANEIASRCEGRMREAITTYEKWVETGVLDGFGIADAIWLLTYTLQGEAEVVIEKLNQLTNDDVATIVRLINDYMKLLLLRKQLGRQMTTEEILDTYTSISSYHLDALRVLQEEIWRSVDSGKEQVQGSVEFMYKLYDMITRHYNDFRDGRAAVSTALLYIMAENV